MEDILEEVIGEIYDEDDIDELVKEESSIFQEADGSYTIDGFAVLEEVVKTLDVSNSRCLLSMTHHSWGLGMKCDLCTQLTDLILVAQMQIEAAETQKFGTVSGMPSASITKHAKIDPSFADPTYFLA